MVNLKKDVLVETGLIVCTLVSLVLVVLPQPYTMVDFPTYNLYESEGKRIVEVLLSDLEISEGKSVKVMTGESFALEGSLGGGVHSELRLAYDIPADDILSLSEEGVVTLTYLGQTMELDIGESWSKTVYYWLGSVPTLEPVPSILLGTLLYKTCEVRNVGYVDQIVTPDESINFEGVEPVFIQLRDIEGGIRFFISPNLAIFTILLAWNTCKLRH